MEKKYRSMCEFVEKNKEDYQVNSSSNYSILNFPLEIDLGSPSEIFLEDVFNKYYKLLELFQFDDSFTNVTKYIGKGIIDTIQTYKTGDITKAFLDFENVLNKVPHGSYVISTITKDDDLYRMRKERDKIEKEEFYCLRNTKRHLCSPGRYSIAGYPCFYVGYSINDCFVEISEEGSICKINLKEENGNTLRVLDLTFNDDPEKENMFIIIWPLIAACNMNYLEGREVNFKEDYIIPQFLTMYVLRHKQLLGVDGIRYYSTRNRNLDIKGKGENDYRNIVFFPLGNTNNYVDALMDMFSFEEGKNEQKIVKL